MNKQKVTGINLSNKGDFVMDNVKDKKEIFKELIIRYLLKQIEEK